MNIYVIIPKTFAGCGFYRLYQPHNHLAKNYGVNVTFGSAFEKASYSAMTDEDIKKFDLVVWHKTYFNIDDIKRVNSLGIPTVLDFDDHWVVNREHSLYKQYMKEGLSSKLHRGLLHAQYITCTTELLAEEIFKYNQNIEVLPNAFDPGYDGMKVNRVKEKDYIFGYLGGPCHVRDVALLRGLQSELSDSDKGYQLRLFGYNGDSTYKFYADILSDTRKSKNFSLFKGADIWHYPQFYNYLDCSLVPLEVNTFNQYKSQLKLIEAGYFKKPVIVSNVEPYKDLAKHCLAVNSKEDWGKHCRSLIREPEKGKDLGEGLHEAVKGFHIQEVNKKRFKFYQDVCYRHDTDGIRRVSRMETIY